MIISEIVFLYRLLRGNNCYLKMRFLLTETL